MMKRPQNAPIGIIDSGIGGLTIWKEIVELLPGESTLYIGDHAFLPYGRKTQMEIRTRVASLIGFLLSRQVKLIVIACNTATVAGIDWYREIFPDIPIIGIVPVIKRATQITVTKNIAIFATDNTVKSAYYRKLLDQFANGYTVMSIGCSVLVPLIEKGDTENMEIRESLCSLHEHLAHVPVDVLALGCTHFPLIREHIQNVIGPGVTLLDSGGAVARQTQRILLSTDTAAAGNGRKYEFLTTGDSYTVTEAVRKLMKSDISFMHTDIESVHV